MLSRNSEIQHKLLRGKSGPFCTRSMEQVHKGGPWHQVHYMIVCGPWVGFTVVDSGPRSMFCMSEQ